MSIKQFSVLFPPIASLVVFAMLIGTAATTGIVREADEGTGAHIFQILMAAQIPVIAFFAVKWMPRAPKKALPILGVQLGGALMACAPVFFWRL